MEKPYTTMRYKDYELTIFHGIDPLDREDDNVDVEVSFPNGESCTLTFFTLQNIKSLMERYKETEESASGLYFCAVDMVIVEKLTEEAICRTIDHLLVQDTFKYADFSRSSDDFIHWKNPPKRSYSNQ